MRIKVPQKPHPSSAQISPLFNKKETWKNGRHVEASRGKQKYEKNCIGGPLETFEKIVGVSRKRSKFLRFTFSPLEGSTRALPQDGGVASFTSLGSLNLIIFFTAPKIKSH